MTRIAVAGTGYVGLVAGVCFAEVGHSVTCVDIDEDKIKRMESGVSPIYESGLEELMQKNYAAGRLQYTVDYTSAYKNADVIFIGVGTDIADVAEGMKYDSRIGGRFLDAGIGYGGSCFPKDTKALKFLARQHGYRLRTVEAAVEVNTDQKTMLFQKANDRLITFAGLKVAVLGLTFKPGTDDLREAPSLYNVPLLLEQGADVVAYDPVGTENFKRLYPEGRLSKGSIRYAAAPEEALQDANLCFVYTQWNQILAISPEIYKKQMRNALVYDGRNMYHPDDMKKAGVEYHSIGRASHEKTRYEHKYFGQMSGRVNRLPADERAV
jgi:UDP-glucose 6-dehydrogenase